MYVCIYIYIYVYIYIYIHTYRLCVVGNDTVLNPEWEGLYWFI